MKGVYASFPAGASVRFSLSQICDIPQAGFEPGQNLTSEFVEWSFAVVITTKSRLWTPWQIFFQNDYFQKIQNNYLLDGRPLIRSFWWKHLLNVERVYNFLNLLQLSSREHYMCMCQLNGWRKLYAHRTFIQCPGHHMNVLLCSVFVNTG